MKTYFISGAEGVGKTTLVSLIKNSLLKADVHDFDDVGVPDNPSLSWRHQTTKYWLKIAEQNKKRKKDTIILGLSFPKEIKKLSKSTDLRFCLLDISIKERTKRLKKKKVSKEIIKDTKQLVDLRKDFKKLKEKKIINVNNKKPRMIAREIINWIRKLK